MVGQIFEIIKTFVSTNLVGWNIPAVLLVGAVLGTAAVYVPKLAVKLRFQYYKLKYKRKLSNIEKKIKDYSITKESKNLVKNLEKRERLRIKAAKRNISLKNEPGLNHITYSQSKLSKDSRAMIINSAKLNLLKLSKSEKAPKFAEKVGLSDKEGINRDADDHFQISERINYPGIGDIELSANYISASKRNPLFIEQSVQNYEKDLTIPNIENFFPTRSGKAGIHPLVMEIEDHDKTSMFKLSDNSPKRFLKYAKDGFANLYNLVEKNLEVADSESKSYKISFYDTADQRNVKQMHTVVSSPADLDNFLVSFDWNFGQVKPLVNYGYSEQFVQQIKDRSAELEYFQKTKQSRNQQKNSFIYSPGLSNNLKSPALENGFKTIVKNNTYTSDDPEPQITTLLIDGREVFKTRVESKDLLNITDRVVDAYIFTLMTKRMLDTGNTGVITKVTEGYYVDKNDNLNIKTQEKKYRVNKEEINQINALYEKNKHNSDFFAAFLAVAKDFKLGIPYEFFLDNDIDLTHEQIKLYSQHLGHFENKNKSLELFGIIADTSEKRKSSYQTVGENPTDFEEVSGVIESKIVEKADHLRGLIVKKNPEQAITTTIPSLEKNFDNDVKSKSKNLKDIPHTVDVICENNDNTKLHFKLGATIYDQKSFKEFFYKILMEALYLIEENQIKVSDDQTPVIVYISYATEQKRKPTKHSFNSIYALRKEISLMKKEYGFMDMDEFKHKYIQTADEGKDM